MTRRMKKRCIYQPKNASNAVRIFKKPQIILHHLLRVLMNLSMFVESVDDNIPAILLRDMNKIIQLMHYFFIVLLFQLLLLYLLLSVTESSAITYAVLVVTVIVV